MKLSNLFVIFAAGAMLMTGCGGKSKTGTKTTFDEFKRQAEALPAIHTYTECEVTLKSKMGTEQQTEVETLYYIDGEWHDDDHVTSLPIGSVQEFVLATDYIDVFTTKEFYLKPFSFRGETTESFMDGSKMTVSYIMTWDDPYGMPTYGKASGKYNGQEMVEEFSIKYKKGTTPLPSSSSEEESKPGQEEVPADVFLAAVKDNHPYTKAHAVAEMSGYVEMHEEYDYTYDATNGWVSSNEGAFPLQSYYAPVLVSQLEGEAPEGFSYELYINPLKLTASQVQGANTMDIVVEYNEYGLPLVMREVQSNGSLIIDVVVTITYK